MGVTQAEQAGEQAQPQPLNDHPLFYLALINHIE
jgi:hypothetical protein